MLLGVVARSFRRIADAAAFEFVTGLGSPTGKAAYQGSASAYAIDTALGTPFGAQGYQVGSDAFAFVTGLGTPAATTGQSGSPADIGVVTGMGAPTATVAYQGDPADIGVVTALGEPSIGGYNYTNTEAQTFENNADTTAWDDTLRDDIDQLISDLKTAGVWSKLDCLFLHDLPNQSDSLRDVVTPTRTATAVNTPTWAANQGFTGNGSTTYINYNHNPSVEGSSYTTNSAALFFWIRTAATGFGYYGGADDGPARAFVSQSSASAYGVSCPNVGGTTESVTASPVGLLGGNRSGASAVQVYKNGSSVATNTTASVSNLNDDIYGLALNNGGTAVAHGDGEISIMFTASSLTGAEAADAYTAFNAYRAAREAEAVVAAFNAQAATDLTETEASHVSTLVESLVAAGVWDKLDMLYLHDLDVEANALRDLKDPTRTATATNSPTFTATEGFAGNGSTSYVDTNYNPSTDATNYAQNSASMGAWVRTRPTSPSGVLGQRTAGAGTPLSEIYYDATASLDFLGINAGTASYMNDGGVSIVDGQFIALNRSGASAQETYIQGSLADSNTAASGALVNTNFLIGALSVAGGAGPAFYGNAQVSATFAGGSLTAGEQSDLYDALNTYRTAREAV